MPRGDEMPLQDVLEALAAIAPSEPQRRAVLATTVARWQLQRGQRDQAIAHLEHALEMVPDLRPAMALLYRLYLQAGDIRAAVLHLDHEIRATRHPREAAALYRERGLLVERHFHDLAAAQQCYQAALKATPQDLAVLRAVERVHLARGDVYGLISNLEAQLEVLQDEQARAAKLHDLALLETRHRGDLALAGDLLMAALDLVPDHLVLAQDLFRVAEISGDAPLMLRALEIEAELRPPGTRAVPLARASTTLRDARERGAALTLLNAAARDQPHALSLWRNLEELAMGSARYDLALEALIGQLDAVGDAEDPNLRAELFYRLGRLALFRLDRTADGLAALRKALQLNPGHIPTLEDMGRFLSSAGLWSQLLELVEAEIASAKVLGLSPEEVALAHLRAGQLLEDRLAEPGGARRHYEAAMAEAPGYRPTRDRLERLLHQEGDPEALARFYEAELQTAQTPSRRRFLHGLLGQVYAQQGDPRPALPHLVAVLKATPDHLPTLQLLARLLARSQRTRELLKITQKEIELTESGPRQAKLLHRSGELWLEQGDSAQAQAAFEAALALVPDHRPSFDALVRLLRLEQDWATLVQWLRASLALVNDRAHKATVALEIARLLATELQAPDDALQELLELLETWPKHLPALHMAEHLARVLGHGQLQVNLIGRHVAALSGPRTRALLLHRAATVRLELDDVPGAVTALTRALDLWPQLSIARAGLLHLLEGLGDRHRVRSVAEAGLAAELGRDDRRALALRLAKLAPTPVEAIQFLGQVTQDHPRDYVSQIRLARACAQVGRASRQAGALAAAAEVLELAQTPTDDLGHALLFRAARAHETAGDLHTAGASYANILELAPSHALAQRGRDRIARRAELAAVARDAQDLQAAAQAAPSAVAAALLWTMAAEQREHHGDLVGAQSAAAQAIGRCPGYQLAWYTRARIHEKLGDPTNLRQAAEALVQLAELQTGAITRAKTLCCAAALARRGDNDGPRRAWELCREALQLAPESDRALAGLDRLRDELDDFEDPSLGAVLRARLEARILAGGLREDEVRVVAQLGGRAGGPQIALELLELGLSGLPEDARTDGGLQVELAQAHGRLDQWAEAVTALEAAFAAEHAPARMAALHFLLADARTRAGDPEGAIEAYFAAATGGYQARAALETARHLATQTGDVLREVEALERLIDLGAGPEQGSYLAALADLVHRRLGQPEAAVELLRQLSLLRPTDVQVSLQLCDLLGSLGRHGEGTATLLAAVANHRGVLRSLADAPAFATVAVVGSMVALGRLFSALGHNDATYVCAGAVEILSPKRVEGLRRCDELRTDPWPLPRPQDGQPLRQWLGNLALFPALNLLHEGAFFLGQLPGLAPPRVDLTPARALPPNTPVVTVVRTLANALTMAQPLVFLDPALEDTVEARVVPSPALVIGRELAAQPFEPRNRDRLARGLMRLHTGGDGVHRHCSPEELQVVCDALCRAAGVEITWAHPTLEAPQLQPCLPDPGTLPHLRPAALALRPIATMSTPEDLALALRTGEDRVGLVAAADPRPTLASALALKDPGRIHALMLYLVSEEHLSLRRTLGYGVVAEIRATRLEEASA